MIGSYSRLTRVRAKAFAAGAATSPIVLALARDPPDAELAVDELMEIERSPVGRDARPFDEAFERHAHRRSERRRHARTHGPIDPDVTPEPPAREPREEQLEPVGRKRR